MTNNTEHAIGSLGSIIFVGMMILIPVLIADIAGWRVMAVAWTILFLGAGFLKLIGVV